MYLVISCNSHAKVDNRGTITIVLHTQHYRLTIYYIVINMAIYSNPLKSLMRCNVTFSHFRPKEPMKIHNSSLAC